MTYQPITPFRRMMDAAVLAHQAEATGPAPKHSVNKYEALRELALVARARYGLNDRDLSVLQALTSFHPGYDLNAQDQAALVVFPSNAALCERLNHMPCSTMRRHLARLVAAGLLIRRDSPNGKRFSRHSDAGRVAYGFDLRPVVLRHADHCALAQEARERANRLRGLRETVSLMRRDLAGLADWGRQDQPDLAIWDSFDDLARLTARDLRRKLDETVLNALRATLAEALERARTILEPAVETLELSNNRAEIERHHQNSDKDLYESKEAEKTKQAKPGRPALALRMVLAVCPEFQSFAPSQPRHWHEFVAMAERLRPMVGIAPSAWQEAKQAMGPEQAAVVLAAMMERPEEIRSPGGYLRHLTAKAQAGAFSVGPMVRALQSRAA